VFDCPGPGHTDLVSGVGADENPCSRTAPCKTFAGAISKTAANGEINCLDPGGFGAVTITKSITISCEGVTAGVLAPMTNGINVAVPSGATMTVYLRGLDIQGDVSGLIGVRFTATDATSSGILHIENCLIRGFNAGTAAGISFAPKAASELYVSNTVLADNGNGAAGGGLLIVPDLAGGANVALTNVKVENNTAGIKVDGTVGTGASRSSTASPPAIADRGWSCCRRRLMSPRSPWSITAACRTTSSGCAGTARSRPCGSGHRSSAATGRG